MTLLKKLADSAPQPEPRAGAGGGGTPFDVETFLRDHDLSVARTGAWQGGTKWILSVCPCNPEHTDTSACIVQFPTGAISFKCWHNGCSGNDWAALRSLYEPEYERRRSEGTTSAGQPKREGPEAVAKTSAWPAAASSEAFHGLAGEIVRTLEPHTEADPHAILIDTLATFGVEAGNGPHYVVGQDRHEMRICPVIVGPTGHGRKGLSHAETVGVFKRAVEDITTRMTTGLSSGEGLIQAVHDPVYRREAIKENGRVVGYQDVEVDAGIADKRLLVVEPEFARTLRVLGREGNILSAVIRQAWDSGTLRTLTKTPAVATGAHIGIIGHITKEELLRHLDNTEAANGFGNRFVWIAAKRSKVLPDGGHVPPAELNDLALRLHQALRFASAVGEMQRDTEARDIWHKVYPSLSQGTPGLFGAITGRSEAQVMRLACIYALMAESSLVQGEHLIAALSLWEYVEATVRYIFGDATGDGTADTILRALRSQGPMTQTGIYDGLFGSKRSAERIAQALSLLTEAGLASSQEIETGGRPATIWSTK